MTDTSSQTLMVLAFDSPLKAKEAHLAFKRLGETANLMLIDAVLIEKDADGTLSVHETVDVSPGDAALRSGFWGALVGGLFAGPLGSVLGGAVGAGVGALAASFDDYGIQNDTLKRLRESMQPATTALAVLFESVNEPALVDELARFSGATLLETTLPPAAVEHVRAALRSKGDDRTS